MSEFLVWSMLIASHVIVAGLSIRFALNERISTVARFDREVTAGRSGVYEFGSVEDEHGARREIIKGMIDGADFTFLMVRKPDDEWCEYNLRVNDIYYGFWLERERDKTRLARLYRLLRSKAAP